MRDQRTYKIIGAALEVHKELGCGFLEAVYQEALGREFKGQEIPFKSQPTIQIFYKGQSRGICAVSNLSVYGMF